MSLEKHQKDISLARSELKNIRQEVIKFKAKLKEETADIKRLLSKQESPEEQNRELESSLEKKDENEKFFNMTPIGFISSCFKNKNGIPRQPSLCEASKAILEINKVHFTNPEHSLIGLDEFPYIWVIFVFHKNGESVIKAKVHPPRLNGRSVGVFSTRSPHRPCAIGLSLIKLERISGSKLFLSGVDLLDGTPVLDIKPYIPSYDIPKLPRHSEYSFDKETSVKDEGECCAESTNKHSSMQSELSDKFSITCSLTQTSSSNYDENEITHLPASSVGELFKRPSNCLEVLFTERAIKDVENFHAPCCDTNCNYCLDMIVSQSAAKIAITEILQNDPRSVYRKDKCSDKLYYFEVDNLHVTCWFDGMIAEVLRVRPLKKKNLSVS